MPYDPKTRDLAFQAWCELRNTDQTLAALRRDYPWAKKLSRPTLAKWVREEGWADRAAKVDVLEQQFRDATADVERSLLEQLCDLTKKYSGKFINLPEKSIPERQDVFAFLKVGKLIEDIIHRRRQSGLAEKSAADQKQEDEELERKAEEILRRDYGIER